MLRVLLLICGLRAVQCASCALGDDVRRLTSWWGSFQSPGWATNLYPNDQQCRWDIRVSQGSRVNLTFKAFSLEEGFFKDSSPTGTKICNDVVKIVDDTVLFSGCGTDAAGQSFLSSGNTMTIIFHSDESSNEQGFDAYYEGMCENNFTSNTLLESPGYPDPPPDNVTCRWTVLANHSAVTLIRPPDSELDRLPECNISSIKWEASPPAPGVPVQTKVLCRRDSLALSQSDVIITYEPRTPESAWSGSLTVEYAGSAVCESFCTKNIQECIMPRTPTFDYRCVCKCGFHGVNCEVYEDPCHTKNCSGQCIAVGKSGKFECQCDDPCGNVTCLHGGSCGANATKGAHCLCPDGYLPPDCHPGPCVPSPCLHGNCMEDEREGFACLCSPDYTGARCSIPTGISHCLAEVDVTVGSGVLWSDTLAGQHDTQPCPGDTEGNATRNCIEDTLSPTRGLWRRPDLSRCVSPGFVNLTRQARAVPRGGMKEDPLYNITRDLDAATSAVRNRSGPTLVPGDLLAACDLLREIAAGVASATSVDRDPAGMLKHFLSVVDNIVSPAAFEVWGNALAHLVEAKVTSVIASSQQFAENLILRHPSMLNASQPDAWFSAPEHPSAVFAATSANVDLRVTEWQHVTDDISLSLDFDGHADLHEPTLVLPPDVITIARGDGADRPLRLYSARFTSVAPLLSLKEYRYKREDNTNVTKIVNSDVISAEVLGLPKSAFSKFLRPVKITFHLKDPSRRPELKKFCVFMNTSARTADDRWLDDGCYVENVNLTHVTCFCYHLTNFAILLDVYDNADKLDEGNSAALSYISYIGGSLSIISCVVVIGIFEYFRLRSDRIRIHEQLAVSIIAVQILFLIGVGRTAAADDTAEWACKMVAILLHFSLTALFCWMLVEGLHLYVLLVKVFKRGSHLKKYCAIGWGVPTLIVGISVGVFYDKYGDGRVCWLNQDLLLVCFVPTVCLVIITNFVMLVLVLMVMFKSFNSAAKANTEHQCRIRMGLKASAVLLPLLGLTWILGFLAVDMDGSRVWMYIFTYLFTITNSFQGVMFFVFHCLLNVDVHNAYERRYRQRKKPVSSLETTTRKNSDVSSYPPDNSPSTKALTKTILSDMSMIHRRPSVAHNRFFLLDRRQPAAQDDLSRLTFEPVFTPALKTSESGSPTSEEQQPSERGGDCKGQHSVQDALEERTIRTVCGFVPFPHHPDMIASGQSTHRGFDAPSRVHFS